MLSAFIKRLMFARQFDIDNGKIEVLGINQIMLSSSVISQLQEIDKKKTFEVIRNVIFKNISGYGKRLGAKSDGLINVISDIYETLGLGKMEIIDLDRENKRALIKIHESTIANAYIADKIKSSEPACIVISAVLSGMFSYLFDKEVIAVEQECIVLGKNNCEFIIK